MPASDSLKRLGGGRWETRDGRFAIEPQSGTWVIVDNEQTDELGLPLVRGPFGSLTAAKEAIEAARTEGPKSSPLAERIDKARRSEKPMAKADETKTAKHAGTTKAAGRPEPAKPEPPPEPRWLRELEPRDQRRARDLIARLEKMGVDDPERVVRAEVADGQPALARLAIERALARALGGPKDAPRAVRAAVSAVLRGADVELGVSWSLVDDAGRRIEKVDVAE
jgi:hypothetical protein